MTRIVQDQRGALFLEAATALLPVALMFILICQVIDAYAHKLIVQHAAVAATRAAVVVIPDDGGRYADPQQRTVDVLTGQRRQTIERAALRVLSASPSLVAHDATLELSGKFAPRELVRVQLSVDYHCFMGRAALLCGSDGKLRLRASAQLIYQGAPYRFTPRG